jgi:uncharacterized protein (DUF58 family)
VKEYRDEFFSRHALVLDTCAGRDENPERFETAVSVAASLIAPLGEQPNGPDGLLDLILYADGVRILTAGRGLLSTGAMLETLACVEPQPVHGFEHIADTLTGRAEQQSACLMVLLSWNHARRETVEQLRRMGMPVTLFVIGGAPGPSVGSDAVTIIDPNDPAATMVGGIAAPC